MTKAPGKYITEICGALGKEYFITAVDFEWVICRDFHDGLTIEVSGIRGKNNTEKCKVYFWNGYGEDGLYRFERMKDMVVFTVRDVDVSEINEAAELGYEYINNHQDEIENPKEGIPHMEM